MASGERWGSYEGMPLQGKRLVREMPAPLPLLRAEALAAQREPLHGPVAVLLPPGAVAAAVVAISTLALLCFAGWLVEVPQRTPAVGVLMPPGGLVRVVATRSGRVAELLVREGERVEQGQDLLRITSDDGAVSDDSVPHARLQSLRRELTLQRDLAREQRLAANARAGMLEEQLRGISAELDRAAAETGLQQTRVDLLAVRMEGIRSLASDGNAAGVQLEQATLDWLAARAAVESLRRQSARLEQERQRLQEERAVLDLETSRREVEQAIATERLARQLPDVEAHVGRLLRAPRAGVVARLMANAGQSVQAGRTLATIHAGDAALEAWLYVPSARAGALREGQAVELRFDAWPSRIFGTRAATIRSVSAIALLPSDLDVPLALPGPVFEIRATLERQSVPGGRQWPLAAGAAVRADLVQQRYRLYEWLFRLRRDEVPILHAPADA